MQENPYAPPMATVSDAVPHTASSTQPAYFPVSVLKLIVLTFGTLGFYQYYWIYKNWKLHRQRTGEQVMPAVRTFFSIIFCYPLLQRIGAHSVNVGSKGFLVGPVAALWIIASLLWKLPDPYWLVTFLAVFALVPVQQAVNDMNRKVAPLHDPNTRFKGWNWVAVFAGLPFFGLAVFGTFFPGS